MDLLFRLNPVALSLLIPGFISALLALYTFNIRSVVGSRVFALVMLAVCLWSLAYGAELAAQSLSSMLLVTVFEYLGIVCVPVLWLILTLIYTGRHQWVRPRYVSYLFIVPVITLVLVSTNQFHHLYYSSVNLSTSGPFPQLAITRGIWYWVNSGYSYLAVLFSFGLLLEKLRHPNPAYRPQIFALLIGVSVPWIVNILYLAFRITLFGNVDITPFAFAVSGLVIAWGIFRFRLFSIIPVAREHIIESMKEGVIVVDSENKLGDVNLAARQIFGWGNADLGRPIGSVLKDWPEIFAQFHMNGNSRQEIIHGKHTDQRHFEITISTIQARGGRPLGRLTIVRDITEWKTLAQKLEQMATHDPLTGLPGRLLLTDRVDMAIARAKRKNGKLAVMMCDLDRFKTINDTLGHGVGDSVLKVVSGRLKEPLRKNETTARLGGDEFVILLPEIASTEEATGAAKRLLLSFQNPIFVNGYALQLSFSLGIAIFPTDGENFEELLEHADTAMYQAKKNGRNRFELFRPLEENVALSIFTRE